MIKNNLDAINEQIDASAKKAGRNPADIKLVAVSKRFPAETISQAYDCGQVLFGENYIQETQDKRKVIPSGAKIHFIGHLQSNKAKIAADTCDMIETVDRFKLAKILNRHLENVGKKINILIQVNIGKDPRKSGIQVENIEQLLVQLQELKNLEIDGLMTMPPLESDPETSRIYFRDLRILSEQLTGKGLFPVEKKVELSMGMSSDFTVAIEEGATIVRVGTAIFGQRAEL
ncbi:MAG: YggS family pyridoxal phosphate-dependent enzyme [Desulfobulbaceae bacterium]|nr:YggS family pyridoxal phosphate-dependent enzyme [Desulfobulbaceae bacterium]